MSAADLLRTVASLLLVVGLIVAAVWAIRRFGLGGIGLRAATQRRLQMVEALPVDARRRLILVRRDGIEHLLLVGGSNDVVVEPGIRPPPGDDSEGTDP